MQKLTDQNRETIKSFHKLWHESPKGTWNRLRWLGVKALKTPTDFWVYQELITTIRPEWIIETGTCFGGSALFLATVCQGLGCGRVLTIDIHPPKSPIKHPRVECYTGSSVAPKTIEHVRRRINGRGPVMVILDSDHHKEHVLKELELYSPLVTLGSYLIVEDTDINRSVRFDHGPGPAEALDQWLPKNDGYIVDEDCERYYLTFCPGGYLRRVK